MSSFLTNFVIRLQELSGVDGAVAFTASARVVSIVSSIGTVLLMVHFLSPVEQGYYYALLSLFLFQTMAEAGFSFVVQQYTAHESALCKFLPDGGIEGDPIAHSRLASVLQLAVRWYSAASLLITAILLPIGFYFFSHRSQDGGNVEWQGPWVAAVLASAISFLVVPIYSFLEGCGQIREVAAARFAQSVAVLLASWFTMITHHGLYAPAMVNVSVVLAAVAFLVPRIPLLLGLLRHGSDRYAISWRSEIWPFQWKLATSWIFTYMITQMFTPVLFLTRGPVEAGRMGMSVNVVAYLPILVLSWITTKTTPFGQLIKLGRLGELDRLFSRALRQSLGVLLLLEAACMGGVIAVRHLFPHFAERVETPAVFGFLLLTAIGTFAVQSMGIYLRSFKEEPFLVQSMVVAALTTVAIVITASGWGALGMSVGYFLANGVIGLAWAIVIFCSKTRHYCRTAASRVAEQSDEPQVEAGESLVL